MGKRRKSFRDSLQMFWRFNDKKSIASIIGHFSATTALAGVSMFACGVPLESMIAVIVGVNSDGLVSRFLIRDKEAIKAKSKLAMKGLKRPDAKRFRDAVATFSRSLDEAGYIGRKPKLYCHSGDLSLQLDAGVMYVGEKHIQVITVSDTVVKGMEKDEINAVLLHEAAHCVGKHSALRRMYLNANLAVGAISVVPAVLGGIAGLETPLSKAFNMGVYGGTASAVAAAAGIAVGAVSLVGHFSRSTEYHADRCAVTTMGGKPTALMSAFANMHFMDNIREHLSSLDTLQRSIVNNQKEEKKGSTLKDRLKAIFNQLNMTHPPLEKRMAALEKIALKQGYSGKDIDEAKRSYPGRALLFF